MIHQYFLPNPVLRGYVKMLQLIHLEFKGVEEIPFKPYWPRAENCLAFYPRDVETVEYVDSGKQVKKTRAILIGQPSVVTNRYVGRDFCVFQVVFQPGALFRLTGIPSSELTNTFVDAESVFSKEISLVNERLSSTDSYEKMIEIVEDFLNHLIKKSKKDLLPVDKVSLMMLENPAYFSLDALANEACLSVKQFYRKFIERMGVSPKFYQRINRFDHAMKLKNAHPDKDWLTIALDWNYHDYQHLVKDFKEFTCLAPTEFLAKDNKAPERAFGLVETSTLKRF
jgi:AraC-like DNA-binding protein